MDTIKKYENWKNFHVEHDYVQCNWSDNDLDFEWFETIQTDEVPEDDAWNIFTTDQKYYLQNLQKGWGVSDSATKHYMSFSPSLTKSLSYILDDYGKYTYSYNLLKLTPGNMLVWHFDTYATFVKRHNLSKDAANDIFRSVVMLTDWDCGHVFQVGNDVLSHWTPGDRYTWQSYTWHGLCNFGKKDIILAQISFIKNNID